MNTFSDWEKMYFLIWLNTFSNLDKYISDLEKCFFWFGQIHFLIWTNTFSELEKYSAPPWQMLGGRTLSMLAMRRPIYPENPPPLSLQPALAGKQEEFRLTWGILPLIGHTSVLPHILTILYLIPPEHFQCTYVICQVRVSINGLFCSYWKEKCLVECLKVVLKAGLAVSEGESGWGRQVEIEPRQQQLQQQQQTTLPSSSSRQDSQQAAAAKT